VKLVDISGTKERIYGSESYEFVNNIKTKNIRYLYREINDCKMV